MMKRLLTIFLLFVPGCVIAQQITITGTVKDPNGIAYQNGSGRAILTPTNVNFTTGLTNPVPGSQSPVIVNGLDSNGHFTITFTSTAAIDQQSSNPQWQFSFCSSSYPVQGPICFTGPTLALTSSQDITVQISAVPPPILPGSGGGAGANPAPPNNVVQKNSAGTFAASTAVDDAGGFHFKGANPYLDVTQYGVRSCNPLTTPCAVGLTASTTSGSTSVTISAASTFIIGDGVVIYGAGAPHSMTTPGAPTVTPSLARGPTGGRDTVAGPAGSTTYNYQIFAEDKNGGLTAVSSVGSTSTGAASLGSQSVNITSCSRTNDVVTCTTSAPHGLVIGSSITNSQEILLKNVANNSFNGWYSTSSVADSTHFSFSSGEDSRTGALTSSTGGTLTWFQCNHISWSAVAGSYRYWIAGRTGGSLTTIGYSWPSNASNPQVLLEGVLSWDDYGSPLMDSLSLPAWIPSTPPASATSDHLVTTISGGAGTTSLTLALAAGTSVTGKTIRLDAVPGIKAAEVAATVTNATFPIFFPNVVSGTVDAYAINSFLDLSTITSPVWLISGPISLFNTVQLPVNSKLSGLSLPAVQQRTSFNFEALPLIEVRTAYPGFHIINGSAGRIEGIAFDGASINNNLLILQDLGSASASFQYRRLTLSTGNSGGASDLMSIALLVRGVPPDGVHPALAGAFSADEIDLLSGPGAGIQNVGITATPTLFCTDCGLVSLGKMMMSSRSIHIGLDPSGFAGFSSEWLYTQGAIMPVFSVGSAFDAINSANGNCKIGKVVLDSTFGPMFTNLITGGGSGQVFTVDETNTQGFPGGAPVYTGLKTSVTRTVSPILVPTGPFLGTTRDASIIASAPMVDGLLGTNSGPNQQINYNYAHIAVGAIYSIFSDFGLMAPPSATVAAGGSVPVGTHQYMIAPVWQNGGTSAASNPVTVTTTPGNQTVNLSWTPTTNCKGYAIFREIGGQLLTSSVLSVSGCASTTYSDTVAVPAGGAGVPLLPGGGPTMLMPGFQGIATPALTVGGLPVFGSAYTTVSATTGAGIGTTTMVTAPASGAKYIFNATAAIVAGGTSCTGNSTLQLFLNYTDAVTNAAQVPTLGGYSIQNSTFAGNNAPVLAVTNGTANTMAINWNPMVINAKGSTTVSYGTTYTVGTGCSPAPTYYVTPALVEIQ